MGSVASFVGWAGLVLAGIYAMQWGATRMCRLLDLARKHWGLPATAGGALMGIATASPEISVNVASVSFGWPDLGLGAALGSNVPALPLIFVLSYVSTRLAARARPGAPRPAAPPRVSAEAVDVQVVPYLLVVALLAALTLPGAWAGLQPVDGGLLLLAFVVYLLHALVRRREECEPQAMPAGALARALLGVPAIVAGALASVVGTRHLADSLGIPDLIGGLFIIGLLCALPESVAAWTLARNGKTTTAVSTAVGDGIVSLTLALVPPALVGAPVGNRAVYLTNLAFLGAVLVAYLVLNHRSRGQELGLARVSLYGGGYGVYLAATVAVLLH